MPVSTADVLVLEDWTSPKWRLNDSGIYKIVDANGKQIPFKMNLEQERLFDTMWYWNIILKARQMGFSTFIGLLALDQSLFLPNHRAGMIAQTEDDVAKLFRNKIRTPYKALPQALRDQKGLTRLNETEIAFGNGSSIQVGMSMRSDTLQFLHVSEFGKICAKDPERAREIVTGAFETLGVGNLGFIESTAEGEGLFKTYCMEALRLLRAGVPLSMLDHRMHFYAWFEKPANRIDPNTVELNGNDIKYFEQLQFEKGIILDAAQKAWYVAKAKILGKDMNREHPSYPEEAFEAHIQGAIYEEEMLYLRKNGRIGRVPHIDGLQVNTFWDFGLNDTTVIWFHQRNGMADCFIDYYETRGKGLSHFVQVLKNKTADHGYIYDQHYLPHDGATRMQGEIAETREEILNRLKIKDTIIVPRVADINVGIDLTRTKIKQAWFDKEKCADGIKALDSYRRQWDEKLGKFKDKPLHDWASNGCDAIRQYGQGYEPVHVMHLPGQNNRSTRSWRVV